LRIEDIGYDMSALEHGIPEREEGKFLFILDIIFNFQ